jgi:hypothetical protein
MGVGQGESGKKTDSYFTELTEQTAVLDPIMSVVMCLFPPPSVADERIVQTSLTASNDLFPTSRPVEGWLAMSRRKWDKNNRTAWRALSLSGILLGYALRREPSSFLLNLSSRRILSSLCPWLPRIGRLNTQNPCSGRLLVKWRYYTSSVWDCRRIRRLVEVACGEGERKRPVPRL